VSRVLAASLVLAALLAVVATEPLQAEEPAYRASINSLPKPLRAQLINRGFWREGCPVALWKLRLLTVSYWDFAGEVQRGQLIVNRDVAQPLVGVFRRLYELRFRIRHLQLDDMYGPRRARPPDGDVSGSFHCRQAVPSPCVSGLATGWSNHAYGYAIDLNPVENPYVGCGRVRDARSRAYLDRSPLRKGMVGPAVVRAFRSIGWGWGGAWTGDTKDYMHFSINGR
jgi:hypothetical protein